MGKMALDRVLPQFSFGGFGKGIANGYNYWNKTTVFKNVKVYQRDDIINPNMKDARGRTNLERMKKGLAPLGPDGKSINLHHTTEPRVVCFVPGVELKSQTYEMIANDFGDFLKDLGKQEI